MPSKKIPVARQKATIGWLDNGEGSTGASASSKVSSVGQDVIERIKKCFERAEHEEKNESEARAAVMMASKYLKRYNLSRADVMEHEDQNTRAARGGMSNVNIWPAKDGGAVRNQAWVNDLVCAIRKFFDCNSYSTNLHDNIEWTFYGIAEHTMSATIAFEMCHNLIQEWAGSYTTVAARNSYSLGVADGLCRLAEQESVDTENAAREAENKAFAARLKDEDLKAQKEFERLRNPPLSPSPTPPPMSPERLELAITLDCDIDGFDADGASDNEEMPDFNEQTAATVVDTTADFDTEIQQFILPDRHSEPVQDRKAPLPTSETSHPRPATPPNDEPEETTEWKSVRQLTVYRNYTKEIEDSVLKEQGVKLRKGRKTKRYVKDRDIFRTGRKDAEKINVKAARIEEEKDVIDLQAAEKP